MIGVITSDKFSLILKHTQSWSVGLVCAGKGRLTAEGQLRVWGGLDGGPFHLNHPVTVSALCFRKQGITSGAGWLHEDTGQDVTVPSSPAAAEHRAEMQSKMGHGGNSKLHECPC